ncbi:endothelin receptor type B-like [Anneissia japonica]|uniref:endothelin receptor type B-like n=1 Tax=Anneissia japonica TaxID=1529436 RepID=UPI0014259428|nr:endothelin receptor type B-like [Anneissia japonica]
MLTNMNTETPYTTFTDDSFSNISTTLPPFSPVPEFLHVIQKIICAFSFIANILLIIVVLNYRKPHTTANLLIVNVAIAHILLIVVRLPVIFVMEINTSTLGCKLVKGGTDWSQAASAATICLLSLERRRATKSLSRSSNVPQHKLAVGVAFLWIFTLGATIRTFITWEAPFGLCFNTVDDEIYTCIFQVLFYILPLMIMSFAYGCVIRSLRYTSSGRSLQPNDVRRILATRRRVSITVFFISVSFCILWFPYSVYVKLIWYVGGITADARYDIHIIILSETMIELNGCVNVLTLCILSHNFRQSLISYICCWFKCESSRGCGCRNVAAPQIPGDIKSNQIPSNNDNRTTRDTNVTCEQSSHV